MTNLTVPAYALLCMHEMSRTFAKDDQTMTADSRACKWDCECCDGCSNCAFK